MRKLIATGALVLPMFVAPAAVAPVLAESGHGPKLLPAKFSFEGPFGTIDRAAAQRGFEIYNKVCATCHSMSQLYYRNLADLGLSEAAVKGIAAEKEIEEVNDKGETVKRPGKPSDRFVKALPVPGSPPDLSLIIKARPDGARYVFSLLLGYEDFDKLTDQQKKEYGLDKDYKLDGAQQFNKYFHPGPQGYKISMPQPLNDGDERVTFVGDAKKDLPSLARDVVTFLAWAAEPHMETRKRTGVRVVLFLLIFAGLMYAVKRKVWADAH
jgi:cytochrome c1